MSLLDPHFRTFITPRLVSWIWRGCLTGTVLVTLWWVLLALWVMTWRSGWLWGVLLLVAAPLGGALVLMCVRVVLEVFVARFPRDAADVSKSGKTTVRGDAAHAGLGSSLRRAPDRRNGGEPRLLTVGESQSDHGPFTGSRQERQGDLHLDATQEAAVTEQGHPMPETTTPPEEGTGPSREGLSMSQIQVAALLGGLVLVVLIVVAVVVGTGGSEKKPAAAPSAAVPQAPVTVTVPAPASPSSAPSGVPSTPPVVPSGSAPAGPEATTPVWTGTMTVVGPAADRDLDSTPPRAVERGGAGDVRADWLEPVLHTAGGADLATLEEGAPSGPSQCAAAVASSASASTETLQVGDVVCVDTRHGHLARLIVTRATQSSTAPTLAFKVTIWPAPNGTGQ